MTHDKSISIDLACDAGEASTPDGVAIERAIMERVTSVHIACGGHAGDIATIRRTIESALSLGLAIGAHPSYPDREGFGRRSVRITRADLLASLQDQVALLEELAGQAGAELVHLKPHGALYHDASLRSEVADAIAEVAAAAGLLLVGAAGSRAVELWRDAGLRVAPEGFADRRYLADGSLRSRAEPDAVISDPLAAADQALKLALGEPIEIPDGVLRLDVRTICVHADTPGAAGVVGSVADRLVHSGFRLLPPGR
ncbi:MAG: LamB/YcsF family protein [Phycisphaerales bacterium]|nr:LamB/YcsF family protein [Phycisphaerales bacterium]